MAGDGTLLFGLGDLYFIGRPAWSLLHTPAQRYGLLLNRTSLWFRAQAARGDICRFSTGLIHRRHPHCPKLG